MNNNELDKLYINEEEEQHSEDIEKPVRKRRDPGFRGLVGILAGIVIGILISAAMFTINTVRSNATSTDLDYHTKIDLILSYLDMYYLGELDDQAVEDALAKGLMDNIGDDYAEYFTAEEFQQMMEEQTGEYVGIGVIVAVNEEGSVQVLRVYDDSPALEAGIQIMDVIVEADGHRDFEDLDELVSYVRGEPGTTVDLVIVRNGEEIPMTVERRNIKTESIYSEMLRDTVGYIQIAEFNTATIQQFNDALDSLTAEGVQSLIMDLRDNPGGDYDSVVAICDRVLPEGPIISTENNLGGIYTDNSDATCLDIPIVLLVNSHTASAAELFAMALHDYDMAQIVGNRTYGKGVVQSIFQLMDGSGLKFTTEKYYGPDGNSIHETGVEPD